MKDIEQKSDMEIKELLRILLQPYTLGVDTVDTYEFYKEYVQDKVNKEKNLQTYFTIYYISLSSLSPCSRDISHY